MRAKRLIIAGRVQGVGFRHWMVETAARWAWPAGCATARDGTVEALVDGDTAAVEELLRACRRGPRLAQVDRIDEELADPPEGPGFRALADG